MENLLFDKLFKEVTSIANMEYDNSEEDQINSVYSDESREDLVDNDEISPEEEGFMMGYDETDSEEEQSGDGDEAYEKAFEE